MLLLKPETSVSVKLDSFMLSATCKSIVPHNGRKIGNFEVFVLPADMKTVLAKLNGKAHAITKIGSNKVRFGVYENELKGLIFQLFPKCKLS